MNLTKTFLRLMLCLVLWFLDRAWVKLIRIASCLWLSGRKISKFYILYSKNRQSSEKHSLTYRKSLRFFSKSYFIFRYMFLYHKTHQLPLMKMKFDVNCSDFWLLLYVCTIVIEVAVGNLHKIPPSYIPLFISFVLKKKNRFVKLHIHKFLFLYSMFYPTGYNLIELV